VWSVKTGGVIDVPPLRVMLSNATTEDLAPVKAAFA
jgi:hypothetical protein